MKKITFIEAVESMQGSLTRRQDLEYAENNNPAFFAPKGQKESARNYRPIYVGQKRAESGNTYFAVRARTSVKLTPARMLQMAVMGGAGAMWKRFTLDTHIPVHDKIIAAYNSENPTTRGTLRQYFMRKIMTMLKNKQHDIYFHNYNTGEISIVYNPWAAEDLNPFRPDPQIVAKFMEQLYPTPVDYFEINGVKYPFPRSKDWETYCQEDYNVLGLVNQGPSDPVFCDGFKLQAGERDDVMGSDTIQALTYFLVEA